MTLDLEQLVSATHLRCVGESKSLLSTLSKLKRIELRMETLTEELERLPEAKVKLAEKVTLRG